MRVQERQSERGAIERERLNVRTQIRAQLANHATSVFVALNAGGLAAALAWLQALPIDPESYTCNYILIHTVPWAAGLLLAGVLATTASYLLRYREDDVTRVQVSWMVAVSLSALLLVGAGGLLSYSILNCRSLAFDAQIDASVKAGLDAYKLCSPSEKDEAWDDLKLRSDKAHFDLQYAGLDSRFKERQELEVKLTRLEELQSETSKRIEQYGPGSSKKLEEELADINKLRKEIEAALRR